MKNFSATLYLSPRQDGRVKAKFLDFRDDEGGGLLIFAMFLFVVMFLMGGLAIDIMRYEQTRNQLQNTLDRSVLAAASLSQQLDSTSVVNDYFQKAGMSSHLSSVRVTNALNSREVVAVGRAATDPIFLPMLGINDLDAEGSSAAIQTISNIEISLVLDVSGSMSGAKITNLRNAASDFVNTVLANDPDHRVSISIVPYNAQVNLGPALISKYNVVNNHTVANSNCLEIPSASFASAAMSRLTPIPKMAYADIEYGTSMTNGYISPTSGNALPNFASSHCKPTTVNTVTLPSQTLATLQNRIMALQAGGNTSITLGMKWGLTLLDPGSRGMFSELVGSGNISPNLAGRPFDYNDTETMKFVILMTDGEHVSHNRINDAFKTGTAPIYRSNGDGQYSIFHATRAGTDKFWVPHLAVWRTAAWNSGAGVTQQNWENVWANLKMSYVAWQFYGRALGTDNSSRNTAYNNAMTAMRSGYATEGQMDASLQQSCTLAKAQDVIVYGIAFEAPANGQAQIAACSSGASYYFNAQGLEIATAFNAIANNISQLKLTQ